MIELSDVDRTFSVGDQPVRALRRVNLRISAGEYIALMGPSGSGKSSLLNILGLLDRPSAGRYRLDGGDVTGLADSEQARVRSQKIGFVFQVFHLVPRLSAADNIALPLVLAGVAREEREPRIAKALQEMGIAERARHRPAELSGGQRQRVAIARAMIMRPAVMLADEPTGNLDRATGAEVMAILDALNATGVTVVLVTHDPEVARHARRLIRLVDGAITTDTAAPREPATAAGA